MAEVYSRDCEIILEPVKIDSYVETLEQAVVLSVVENSTTRNLKGMRDLILHRYEDETRVSLAVENKVKPTCTLPYKMFCVSYSLLNEHQCFISSPFVREKHP